MKPKALTSPFSKMRSFRSGFTLMETVIAILVLAVLLTGFLTVFTPAAQGIRRSISTQQADRLKATLEKDMSTLRFGEEDDDPLVKTGFDKAFKWIKEGNSQTTAIFVYQYRGDKTKTARPDGTLQPMNKITGKPGIDYVMQTAARRADDALFDQDMDAIVGPLFYVIPTQLVFENNELVLGNLGEIKNPDGGIAASSDAYTDAVITFSAAFFISPASSANYINSNAFSTKFSAALSGTSKPIFVRNLAVRR